MVELKVEDGRILIKSKQGVWIHVDAIAVDPEADGFVFCLVDDDGWPVEPSFLIKTDELRRYPEVLKRCLSVKPKDGKDKEYIEKIRSDIYDQTKSATPLLR